MSKSKHFRQHRSLVTYAKFVLVEGGSMQGGVLSRPAQLTEKKAKALGLPDLLYQ